MKIIGISGTNGSGKDTLGRFLTEKYGYQFLSVTDLLRAEARKRDLGVDRENLRNISAEWRRDHGLGVLIDKAVEHFEDMQGLQESFTGLAVASLRNPGEADRIHELGGKVVWIDGDPRVRYERIQANAAARDRAEEDNKTFEQFQAEEAAEMTSSGDEATLNMQGVKEKADIYIQNDTNDVATFEQEAEVALSSIL